MYGVSTILVVAVLSSLIFSLILFFTQTQEHSLQLLITIISFFGIFAGGYICGGKGKQKGWLLGASTGIVYSCTVFLFQYLGHGELFSVEQLIYYVCYVLTAMMGGVLGVNIHGGSGKSS